MLKSFLLMFSILMLNSVAFPQKKSDLDEWGVKGRVQQINYYESYDVPYPSPERSTAERLSGISVLNRRGNLSLRFEFFGYGNECSYKKTVYSYDRKHRKKAAALYESKKNIAFCVTAPPLIVKNQTANFEGQTSLIEKTTYEYDFDGRLIRETIFDANQTIIQENTYEYNARGDNTRFTITQQRNRISGSSGSFVKTIDFRMSYDQDLRKQETRRYEDGKLNYKTVYYKDQNQRPLKEEQFKIELDARNNIVKETLTSFSKSLYDGSREIFDWEIFDNAGKLTQQLYLLLEDDNELMRLEYVHRDTLIDQTESGQERLSHYRLDSADDTEINQRLKYLLKFDQRLENPEWIARRFEATFYKFDRRNNVIQSSNIQKDNPAEKIDRQTVYKKDIIYYR